MAPRAHHRGPFLPPFRLGAQEQPVKRGFSLRPFGLGRVWRHEPRVPSEITPPLPALLPRKRGGGDRQLSSPPRFPLPRIETALGCGNKQAEPCAILTHGSPSTDPPTTFARSLPGCPMPTISCGLSAPPPTPKTAQRARSRLRSGSPPRVSRGEPQSSGSLRSTCLP